MEGSRFIVRHVDMSVAAPETVWRWRGWATREPGHPLRDHRTLDVYLDGSAEARRVVDFHEPISAGLMQTLAPLEGAVADVVEGIRSAARPSLGALRSARRGTFRTRQREQLRLTPEEQRRMRRPAQPARLHRTLVDITDVWDGATVRIEVTRRAIQLHVRSTNGLELGDLPGPVLKALRYAGGSIRDIAQLELQRAAHALARRVPSHALATEVEVEFDLTNPPIDRALPHAPTDWERELDALVRPRTAAPPRP